jgi:tyrosine-protein kinase Etk/Wzc
MTSDVTSNIENSQMKEINPQFNESERDDEFDFITLLDILLQNRWLIAGCAVVFMLIGGLYALIAKPIYSADISVQVEDSPDTSAAKSLVGDVSSLFEVKSTAAAEAQILGSRMVVTKAVENLLLYINAKPRYFPLIGEPIAKRNKQLSGPGLFGLGGFAWGNEKIVVKQFDVPPEIYDKEFHLISVKNNHFRISSSVLDEDLSGTVGKPLVFNTSAGPATLLVESIQARPGVRFVLSRSSELKTITDLQTALDIQEKVKQSGVVIASLQDRDPERVSRELNEIARQYIQQNIERKAADAAQSLEFLNGRLPALKRDLEESEQRYTALRNAKGTVDLTEEAKLSLGQAADAQTRMLELRQKRDELETRFNPSHPSIVALNEQIAALAAQASTYDQQVKRLPDIQQDVVRLMLDVKINTDLYVALLNSAQQLQLVKAGKVGNVRWVDHAAVPEIPTKPKKVLVVAIATVLGIFVGVGIAFLRDMLFRGVEDPSQIERFTGLNVYATIPFSQNQLTLARKLAEKGNSPSILSTTHPKDAAVESLRSFRTALQFAMLEARNNVVLLTGPAPGVGKSFVSTNFATILAAAGKRVLLIDGDMRKGYLQQYFGLERAGGLSEVISGSITLAQATHRHVVENLDFLSTGVLPPNPAELLLNERVPKLFQEASALYDIVIIDSPPVLVAADAPTIALNVGATFLVVRSGVTKVGEVTESAKRLGQVGVQVNGVLFNGIRSGIGRYAYGSKYGSYRYAAYNYAPADRG